MNTPSKKILLTACACLLVLAGIYYTTRVHTNVQETTRVEAVTPEILAQSIKSSASVDTDKDGLMDWEEVLWKTDPFSADSDKDGILDAEDVKTEETAATKTGENTLNLTGGGSTIQSGEDLTLTDTFARQVFMKYIEMKQAGIKITPETAQSVAEEILGKDPLGQNLQQFTGFHITNLVEDTEENIRTYGNAVWDIMVRNTPQRAQVENEYVILLTAIQKQSDTDLALLDPIIFGYTNTIKELVTMNVPKSAVKTHIEFINSMNSILGLVEDMRVYFSDSIRGLRALTQYQTHVLALRAAFVNLVSYIREHNIEYVEGESGYTLMHSI